MIRLRFIYLAGFLLLGGTGCGVNPEYPNATMGSPTSAVSVSIPTVFLWFPPTDTPSPEVPADRLPTPERKPGIGRLLLEDGLSSAADWSIAVADQAALAATEKGLTIGAQPGLAPVVGFRQGVIFSDMYAEITARPSLCRGADDYGLVFRAPNDVAYYRFAVACDGTAGAERISLGGPRMLQSPTPSADVPVGAPGAVRLGVWAVGSEFRFFLNGRYQFTASDKSYSSGGIGVFAHAAGDTPVIVAFSDLSVYDVEATSTVETPAP